MSHRILLITGDAGESYECLYARHRFMEAGLEPVIAAPTRKRMNLVIHDFEPGWDTYIERQGYLQESDITFDEVNVEEYDAILLLGGRAPEYLRLNEQVLTIVRHFAKANKPIAAICHGLQLLAAAGVLEGRSCTAYPACGPEVTRAGGTFVDQPPDQVHVDGKLVTAPAWPAHPAWIAAFLKVLGAEITL